jgi:hypothetical protein
MKSFKQFLKENTVHPMIDVDGVKKHRHNSEGKPIHHTDEGIKNFHKWFGDSKVTDEHGRPQVVYHGTNANFNEFDINKINPCHGGHYFSDSSVLSSKFAGNYGSVKPVYLKIKNPIRDTFRGSGAVMDKSEYRDGGIFTKSDNTTYAPAGTREIVAFHPNQIKSAIGNSGNFSKDSNKITESE